MIAFEVSDMTCGHCASTITKAVRAIDAAADIRIDLPSHRVEIESRTTDTDAYRKAIVEAGFSPRSLEG